MDTGHYVCYAKSGPNWFEFDDQMVTLASPKAVNSGHA
jgi:ubiquitin C-terminal hydrolase